MNDAKLDNRFLRQKQQDELRARGIDMVRAGMRQAEVARALGVRPATVCLWMRMSQSHSSSESRKRGPVISKRKSLVAWQEEEIFRSLTHMDPKPLTSPLPLWTRDEVADLIKRRFGVSLSRWTVSNYLAKWGLAPQIKDKTAEQQEVRVVRTWIRELPQSIRENAKRETAEVWFLFEPLYVFHAKATCSCDIHRTTHEKSTAADHYSCRVISAINGRGKRAFSVLVGNLCPVRFIEFLTHLCNHAKRKIYLVLGGDSVHRDKEVTSWAEQHPDRICLVYRSSEP